MRLSTILFLTVLSLVTYAQNRSVTLINDRTSSYGKTYAIIIGISKYKNLPHLQYADKDAQVFYDYLVSKRGLNIDSANVALCINEAANINNLGNNVSDILQREIKSGDKVIFFFAGHGDYDAKIMQDQALLLLYSAPNGNYFQNVFSGDFISTNDLDIKFTSELIKRGAEVILIIDACHSGGMSNQLPGGEQGGIITANALNMIKSSIKLYSCQANQYSLESSQFGGGRGLFSYILMEGLYGLADVNPKDKQISLKELQRYLEDFVPALASPNKQNPIVKMEDNTEIFCDVNIEFLTEYKKAKDKKISFLASATLKGIDDDWLSEMSKSQKELYIKCKKQLENKNLDSAFSTYRSFELLDKTSDASVLLRRNLSAALQEKAANIISPLIEDISNFGSDSKNVENAIDELEKASELLGKEHFLYDKLQARQLFLKALDLMIKGQSKTKAYECLHYLEHSAELEPNASYTYFCLSNIYEGIGKILFAEINIKKYLDLVPNSTWAHYNYAILLSKQNKYSETEKEYKMALQLDQNNVNAHYNYANLLYDLNRNKEAEKEFLKVIEIKPDLSSVRCNYGLLLQSMNRYHEAENEFQKAITLDPGNPIYHNNYGVLLYNLKMYKDAEREYMTAIHLNPENPKPYYFLTCLYSVQDMTENAIFYFGKTLQKGMRELSIWQLDSDLDNIRKLPEFKYILLNYYSLKELDRFPGLFSQGY
jgi:tetratricopeptide (TPR) repeat protein